MLFSKEIKAVIFDMDGVLLDSMQMWLHAVEIYLEAQGIVPGPGVSERVFTMSMMQVIAYLQEEYGLQGEPEAIMADMDARICRYYAEEVSAKAGAEALLNALQARGIPAVVATATNRISAEAGLKRCGLWPMIRQLFCCTELNTDKNRPDIYLAAAASLGLEPADCLVVEDALHAATTAKKAGFRLLTVYDEASTALQPRLQALGDGYVRCLEELHFET